MSRASLIQATSSVTGGTEEDVKCRIGKARLAFNMLRSVWNASSISIKTKLRIFTTHVKHTLLYGSETWKVTQVLSHKLQSFVNKCLRKILKIPSQKVLATKNFGAGKDKSTYHQLRKQEGNGFR